MSLFDEAIAELNPPSDFDLLEILISVKRDDGCKRCGNRKYLWTDLAGWQCSSPFCQLDPIVSRVEG